MSEGEGRAAELQCAMGCLEAVAEAVWRLRLQVCESLAEWGCHPNTMQWLAGLSEPGGQGGIFPSNPRFWPELKQNLLVKNNFLLVLPHQIFSSSADS